MILCGDIGGTKALLGLAEIVAGKPRLHYRQRLECAHFSDFDSLLQAFLAAAPAQAHGGCLAVAGPVADDGRSAKLTNLPWTIDCATLERDFAIPRLQLVNDFAAAARGVTATVPEDLTTLQAGAPLERGVKLVVGAGTGLGMALLTPDATVAGDDDWRVLPGEGGHVGFSPQNEIQARIWAALLKEHGRVTNERLISGPGLAAIHRILTGETLEPAAISTLAVADKDSSTRESVNTFLAAYGAFAGDMAMAVMARGGVYLAGGIATRLLPLLAASPFLPAFNAKAEHATLAARMPVHVVTDPDLGLKGAALLAGC